MTRARSRRRLLLAAAFAAFHLSAAPALAGATFDAVKARGYVICGVHTGRLGFALSDDSGTWKGFDVDMCRAVAAAMFGDAGKVTYVPTKASKRLFAVQSKAVDMLARNTTWTLIRDTTFHLEFAAVNYVDLQGILTRKVLNAGKLKDLAGRTVCVDARTSSEVRLSEITARGDIKIETRSYDNPRSLLQDYVEGRCDAITGDSAALASLRSADLPDPDAHAILAEAIGIEPLALVVREDDIAWRDIVRWSFFATVAAETLGVTSANVDTALASPDPRIKRLLGVQPGTGKALGLDERWAYQVIKQVGNYAEIFERNLGASSPLKLPRGPNALWSDGGVLYSPPFF